MKKALIIGGNGTIGSAVSNALNDSYEIITAGRTHGDVKVDITSVESITQLFETVGEVDAVIITAGQAHFGSLKDMTPQDNLISVNSKLLGQVNTVLIGTNYVKIMAVLH